MADQARAALTDGRPEYARLLAETGIEANRLDTDLQYLHAKALIRLKKEPEAVGPLRRAHEMDPGNEIVKLDYVSLLLDLERFADAYEVWPEKARAAYERNLLANGLAGARTAYSLWPEDMHIRQHLVDGLLAVRSKEADAEAWEKVPDIPKVEEAYLDSLLEWPFTSSDILKVARCSTSCRSMASGGWRTPR